EEREVDFGRVADQPCTVARYRQLVHVFQDLDLEVVAVFDHVPIRVDETGRLHDRPGAGRSFGAAVERDDTHDRVRDTVDFVAAQAVLGSGGSGCGEECDDEEGEYRAVCSISHRSYSAASEERSSILPMAVR